MTRKHWMEIAAMVIIGEGILGAIHPRSHVKLWSIGPKPLRALMNDLADYSSIMRLLFVLQIVLGYFIAKQQYQER